VQCPGWPFALTGRPSSWGEVPILEFVNERLWLMICILSMINQGQLPLTDGCNSCGTSVQPLQSVKPIQKAESAVMDGWVAILFLSSDNSKNDL
jgi:hypothetical protein